MQVFTVILTTLLSVAALFGIAKLMGHKQISQLDFFDYICGITIGSIAAELATELEQPLKPLLAMLIYGGVSVALSRIAERHPRTRKFLNGTPTILLHDGKLYRENLRKAKLELSEFMVMCREQGYFQLTDIQTAVFEHNGKLSILPVSTKRPATPEDLHLAPAQEHICTEIILDGRVLEENLRRMGLDARWLEKQLAAQGYRRAEDVFLGLCDAGKNVSLYPMD